MNNSNEISVKLTPPSTSEQEQEKAKYFKEKINDEIDKSIKSEWAIKFEEIGYTGNIPVYTAYISAANNDDFHKIQGIITTLLREIQLKRIYPILEQES